MKRNNKSRAAKETVRPAKNETGIPASSESGVNLYPGLMGIEIGVPYSRRFEPPYVSRPGVREEEDEEDYDICQ